MSLQRLWAATLLFLLLGTSSACQSVWGARLAAWFDQTRTAEYGEKVIYFQGQPIAFPDFTLTYQGERHVASDKYPRGFDYQDFQVTAGDETQIVSWSSGTGAIGPSFFTIADRQYQLDLTYADAVGRLADDEVFIMVDSN